MYTICIERNRDLSSVCHLVRWGVFLQSEKSRPAAHGLSIGLVGGMVGP